MKSQLQLVNGKKFNWGEVLAQHKINNYLIVEYLERDSNDLLFHSYIQFQGLNKYTDTCISSNSLDEAILKCLEVKYLGLNSEFTDFAVKMLDMEKRT